MTCSYSCILYVSSTCIALIRNGVDKRIDYLVDFASIDSPLDAEEKNYLSKLSVSKFSETGGENVLDSLLL
jgi:hypothetical protein